MKKLLFIFSVLASLLFHAQQNFSELVRQGNFEFVAERAHPSNIAAQNTLLNFPGRTSSQILELDRTYSLVVKDGQLVSVLPYFGQRYQVQYGNPDSNSYRFIAKEFTVAEERSRRRSTFTIVPKNIGIPIVAMFLEVYKNGKAYLSINSSDRAPISYEGYIVVPRK